MIFECSLKYYADDLDSPIPRRRAYTDVIACSADNYTNAEAIATQWGMDNLDEDFHISPIKELPVSGCFYSKNKEGDWFKVSCEYQVETKDGASKTSKISYLIQEEGQFSAITKAKTIMHEEGFKGCVIRKVELTKIKEYIV